MKEKKIGMSFCLIIPNGKSVQLKKIVLNSKDVSEPRQNVTQKSSDSV